MKRFSEQFHKESQTVKLPKSEQAELRDRIVSYMEYHPLPAELKQTTTKNRKSRQPVLTEAFTTYRVPVFDFFKYGSALAAIMLVVVPFVAERAVPGDTLYAVKVNFNEEVRGTLTLDPYQKVEWETTRLNRRIAEAKALDREGLLTPEVGAEVAAAVKQHADNAKANIETIRASDADTASIAAIELESTLAVQAQSLTKPVTAATLSAEMSTSTEDASTLIAAAIGESSAAMAETVDLPSLERLVPRVEEHTTRVRELQLSLSEQLNPATMADVTRRIEDLERSVAEALALGVDSEPQAQVILVDVIARAKKLVVFMTEFELRDTLPVESVVPVVLTPEEKAANRSSRLAEIEVLINQLTAATPTDEAVAGKVTSAIEQLNSSLDLVTAMPPEAYAEFMTESDQALALGADTLLLLEARDVVVPPDTDTATSTATTTDTMPGDTPEIPSATSTASTTATTTPAIPTDTTPATTTTPIDVATTTSSSTETLGEPVDDQQ